MVATHAALTDCIVEDLELKWLQGEQIDLAAYASLTNTLRRLLATLGLERRARDVTSLGAILRGGQREARP